MIPLAFFRINIPHFFGQRTRDLMGYGMLLIAGGSVFLPGTLLLFIISLF
jgi:hypothetical protein